MKGIVFNEFVEMVEESFGEDIIDEIMDRCELSSGGAYTSVGTYDAAELVSMVTCLSDLVETPVSDLLNAFGLHLATVFSNKYKAFFDECPDALSFLKKIDGHIHVEVAKLYLDAELPKFSFDDSNPDVFHLTYESKRGFADLAQGLIEGSFKYFNEPLSITRQDLSAGENTLVQFTIAKP